MKTLKEIFKEPTDIDVAQFKLGAMLGFWEDNQDSFLENKGIFWSDNSLGNFLYRTIESLVRIDVLEANVTWDKIEANQNFNP